MEVFIGYTEKDMGDSVYKHYSLEALFSYLSARKAGQLNVEENKVFTLRLYGIPFYFFVKRPSFEEFAYTYKKTKMDGGILKKLYSLRVLRFYYTQDFLRDRIRSDYANTWSGWIFKDLFSDSVIAYQAFAFIDGYFLTVRW